MSESDDSTECLEAPIFGEIRGENCAVVRISRPSPLNSVISSDTNQVLNQSETLDTDPQSPLSVGQETSPIESDLQESPQEQKAVISRLTQRHYVSHVQMFKDWLKAKDFPLEFEYKTPRELNEWLAQFYRESETKSGYKRKASSLRIIRSAIEHHLRSEPFSWPYSLTQSSDFAGSNAVLHQLENIRQENMIALPDLQTSALAIKPEDVCKLWATGVIGVNSPKPLQRLVFLVVAVNFGITSRDFLHDLTSEMFQFYIDQPTGLEYVQCKAVKPENFQRLSKRARCSSKKVYSLPGCVQCPVSALKLYLQKRNPACSAFFQVPNRDFMSGSSENVLWYKAEATGVNTLSKMMKDMSQEAGLSMEYTNNSLRSTPPVTLFKAAADCFFDGSHMEPWEKAASKHSAMSQSNAFPIEGGNVAGSLRERPVPILPVHISVPKLSDSKKATDISVVTYLNGEGMAESSGTTDHSEVHVSNTNDSIKASAMHPVFCIPEQWEIKDLVRALHAGEALLLAKQRTPGNQHLKDVTCVDDDSQPINMHSPTRSSRKQPDPKRLRRDPDIAEGVSDTGGVSSFMEAIAAIKSQVMVLEGLQRNSVPSSEDLCELQQVRQRLDNLLAYSNPTH